MPKPRKPKRPPKKATAARALGPVSRWPQAILGAWLGGLAVLGFPDAFASVALSPSLVATGLAFGTTAAWALAYGLPGGVLGGALGIGLAGLATPVGLTPLNWALCAVGAALGLGAYAPSNRPALRPALFTLVHLGLLGLVGLPGLAQVLASCAGVLAALVPLPLGPQGHRRGLMLAALFVLAGAARTIDAGFVRVTVDLDRALLAEWGEASRVLPARSRSAFWVGAEKPVFRARVDGLSFLALPATRPGLKLPSRTPDAVDLAELGFAPDCEALGPLALSGDARARVQLVLGACPTDLHGLAASDPAVDAAYVLRGGRAADAPALLAADVDLPLNEPGAVILAARVRLDAPKAAAKALVDGSPYDRALLLAHLDDRGRAALVTLLTGWADEVPGPPGQPYREALDAVRR